MAYRKLLVDNPTCSRRFHLTYDDSTKSEAVSVECPYCQVLIFESPSHPPVTLARQENLIIQDTTSADRITRACQYRDVFSEKTQKTNNNAKADAP